MVLILILHIARVYLTGGFLKPREFIWITGIILAVTTVSFGVSGYSLPFIACGSVDIHYLSLPVDLWIFITLGPSWLLGI